jgi:hypothetical protein
MDHKARPISRIETEPGVLDEVASSEVNSTPLAPSGAYHTHPDPERERVLNSILVNAWPKIKASMFYVRDR